MKHHPYSEIWPELNGRDLDKLALDIAAYGLRLAIVTYQDRILDGRAREAACLAAGVEPRYEEANVKNDAEALALIVSLNQHRRHLSVTERAFIGAKLANISYGHNQYRSKIMETHSEVSIISPHQITIAGAAEKLQISDSTIERAKVILAYGDDDDEREIRAGRRSLFKRSDELRDQVRAKRKPKVAKPPKRAKPGRPRKNERTTPQLVHDRPPLHDILLTREQVDPEFTGSAMDWVDKYGHVQVKTAAQYASMRFGAWARNMMALAKEARRLPDWPDVDHNWLRQPGGHDINKLAEALALLRPKIAEAEALLETAAKAAGKADNAVSDTANRTH